MSFADWDKELEVVAREIATVRAAHAKGGASGTRPLIARKVAIIQAQINLERNVERIKKLTTRDYLLLPREKTLLHWGHVYVEKLSSCFSAQSKLMTKSLWLKLIKTRLSGPDGKPTGEIDPDDLVSLALRQQSLQKTEQYLAEKLVKLRVRKKELIKRYEELGIAEANRVASGSLSGRLGTTPEDALESPPMRALALYVRQLAGVLREDDEPVVERTQRKFEKKAARMVSECRDLVVETLDEPAGVAVPPPDRSLNEFKLAMMELAELEEETREAYDRFLSQMPPEPKAKVVAKRVGPMPTKAFKATGKG